MIPSPYLEKRDLRGIILHAQPPLNFELDEIIEKESIPKKLEMIGKLRYYTRNGRIAVLRDLPFLEGSIWQELWKAFPVIYSTSDGYAVKTTKKKVKITVEILEDE